MLYLLTDFIQLVRLSHDTALQNHVDNIHQPENADSGGTIA